MNLSFTEEDAAAFVEDNKQHINRLRKTVTNLVTMQQVLYFHKKLQEFEHTDPEVISNDQVMLVEALMTTIVMSYGRLFAESNGVPVFKRKLIPEHLQAVHSEIIKFRNEKYAHHGNHETTAAEIELFVSEDDVEMKLHWWSSTYNGAARHWSELFNWLNGFLKESFKKQLKHLSKISGKEWKEFEPDMAIEDIIIDTADKVEL